MTGRIGARTDLVPAGFTLQVSRDGRGRWAAPPRDACGRWLDRALDTALGAHSPPPGAARERVTAALVARLIVDGRPCRVAAPVAARLRIVGARSRAGRPARAPRAPGAHRLGAGTGAFSLCVLVAAMQAATTDARAQERAAHGPWYLGVGAGASRLEPEPAADALELDEDASTGFHLFAGRDLSRRFSLEGYWAELGEAGLARAGSDAGDVGYSVFGLAALARLGDASRPGPSGFLSAGVGGMRNDADVEHQRENDVHLALGAGLEYGFGRGVSLRAELRGFDTDASYASLSIAKRFGRAGPRAPGRASAVGGDGAERATLGGADPSGAAGAVASAEEGGEVVSLPAAPVSARGALGALAVRFDFDSAALGAGARAELDALAARIAGGAERIELHGHADGVGPDTYNVGLSTRRAEAVRDALVERGVDPARVAVRGFGERRPVRSNATPEGRAANRRVEVLLET